MITFSGKLQSVDSTRIKICIPILLAEHDPKEPSECLPLDSDTLSDIVRTTTKILPGTSQQSQVVLHIHRDI